MNGLLFLGGRKFVSSLGCLGFGGVICLVVGQSAGSVSVGESRSPFIFQCVLTERMRLVAWRRRWVGCTLPKTRLRRTF